MKFVKGLQRPRYLYRFRTLVPLWAFLSLKNHTFIAGIHSRVMKLQQYRRKETCVNSRRQEKLGCQCGPTNMLGPQKRIWVLNYVSRMSAMRIPQNQSLICLWSVVSPYYLLFMFIQLHKLNISEPSGECYLHSASFGLGSVEQKPSSLSQIHNYSFYASWWTRGM